MAKASKALLRWKSQLFPSYSTRIVSSYSILYCTVEREKDIMWENESSNKQQKSINALKKPPPPPIFFIFKASLVPLALQKLLSCDGSWWKIGTKEGRKEGRRGTFGHHPKSGLCDLLSMVGTTVQYSRRGLGWRQHYLEEGEML